jgi:hypothetical protein
MRTTSRCSRGVALAILCAVLGLGGCGGDVAVRSRFSGAPIGSPTPVAPSPSIPSGAKGFYAAGDGSLVLAVIVGMMIVDGMSWASQRFGQALAAPGAQPQPAELPAEPAAAVHRPARSWVFSRP